jgi:hypothetical protein
VATEAENVIMEGYSCRCKSGSCEHRGIRGFPRSHLAATLDGRFELYGQESR